LPEDPGHAIWKRDFLGASGLFGFVLKPCLHRAFAAFLDHMSRRRFGRRRHSNKPANKLLSHPVDAQFRGQKLQCASMR